jgi:hypothetical protein
MLAVKPGEFSDPVGRQPTAQVEVSQLLRRPAVLGGLFGAGSAVRARRDRDITGDIRK